MKTRVLLAVALSAAIASTGCATARNVALEASCGLGRDYVCGPVFQGNHYEIVCGCVSGKELK